MRTRSRSPLKLAVIATSLFCLVGSGISPAADAPRPALVPINLALQKTVTASSIQDDGRKPMMAVDGDPGTRWCASGPAVPEWLEVDLKQPEEITACRVLWEKDGTPYRYRIEVSADRQSWQPFVDQTAGDLRTQFQEHKREAKDVRYVKLTIVGLSPGAWASLFEFEVLGRELVKAFEQPNSPAPRPGLLAGIKAPKGFEVNLFAAPPDINYPTCLAAAPTGELYVGVDLNGSLDAKPERGSVVRCIDEDGDGQADKFNVFARMDSPRGVHFDKGTLYVLHPPRLTAFRDENGDGLSDRQDVLVEGIGFDLKHRGADHTTNGLRLGIDGWLYIAVGDYGFVKATGKDGQSLQLHGGGVVRVRTDGTGLEVVSHGQRNIYDVAVDPLLNAFTRDNTNDGGGWDVRLSHIVNGGQYGYPSLFLNFPDEIIQPLADYGGGSPCGSLFVDESALPEPFGRALYTCEWGRSAVYRHPLVPRGASFAAGQEAFLEIPRPTDMDVDGQGRLYVSSWRDGGFNYSGPNVGYVVQVRAVPSRAEKFPQLGEANEADLLRHLSSSSHVLRLATQREMLRRGDRPALAAGLEQICTSPADAAVKVAAIFTLKQLRGAAANDALTRLTVRADLREFALRALADNKTQLAEVPLEPFVAALKDADPRVRLQAVIGLGRLDKPEAAAAVVPLLADDDPLVAHLAVDTLVKLRASAPCFQALDSGQATLLPGCVRVLQSLHEPAVADGLIQRLDRAKDTVVQNLILKALCRLYYREAEWTGDWWSTRPDTSGPYYNRTRWEKTAEIGSALSQALAAAEPDVARGLLVNMAQNKIESTSGIQTLLKLAAGDAALSRAAVRMLEAGGAVPDEAAPILLATAGADDQPIPTRASALRILTRMVDRPAGFEAAVRAFGSIGKHPNNDLLQVREGFARDGARAAQVEKFSKLIGSTNSAERETACVVLVFLAGDSAAPQAARDAAQRAIDSGWQSPETAAALLRAIGWAHAEAFALLVRGHLPDPVEEVRTEAQFAAGQLRLNEDAGSSGPKIATLKFEDVLDEALEQPGNAGRGAQLFARQGCVSCHTVSQNEALKGPLLAGISARYSRKELAESILKPSAKIAQGFESQFFVLDSGKVIDGFVVRESGDEIELRGANGQTTVIVKSQIDERGKRETSIMPTGLVDPLSTQDLASLLAYLESLKAK